MTTCFLAPDPVQSTFFIPGSNTPGNGVQLFIYQAGTTTKTTVYKDNAASVAWANPIVLDSGGNLPSGGTVWIPQSQTCKFVWAPATDTDPPASPYRTIDNVSGINDVSLGNNADWQTAPTPVFVSANSLRMSGDQTAAGNADVNRRMKFTVTGPPTPAYGAIQSRAFATGSTTINLNMTVGALDAGLTAAFYGINTATNPSDAIFGGDALASSIAIGSTTNVWASGGNYGHLTGTGTVSSFGQAAHAGQMAFVTFEAASSVIKENANISTGVQDIVTQAGDQAWIVAESATVAAIKAYRFKNPGRGMVSQCQLNCFGSSTIQLLPLNGNLFHLPGRFPMIIPPAGVNANFNTALIQGTTGVLLPQTIYDVYGFYNVTALALDFYSTTAFNHSSDPATGIEIFAGNSTRAYVGKVFTAANSSFQQNLTSVTNSGTSAVLGVLSWFNQRPLALQTQMDAANTILTNVVTEPTKQPRLTFLSFGDDCFDVHLTGSVSATSTGQVVTHAVGLDSTSAPFTPPQIVAPAIANAANPIAGGGHIFTPSEGLHFVAMLAGCTGNSGTGVITVSSFIRMMCRG